MATYLVVADRSAWSMGLARSLYSLGQRDHAAEFVLLVPADPAFQVDEEESMRAAWETAARARTSLRLEGLTVLEALAGPAPPRKALENEMSRGARSYDGILVGVSRRHPAIQIQPDLVSQLERRHGIPVRLINLNGVVMI